MENKLKEKRAIYDKAHYDKARRAEYYKVNKEKINPRNKAYRDAHRAELAIKKKAYKAVHKERYAAYAKTYVARPGVKRRCRLRRALIEYGLTIEEYQALFVKQGGVCAICELPEVKRSKLGRNIELGIDHDHNTGAVRGLLCVACNTALGALKDDARIIQKAADYLAAHGGPESA